MQLRFWMKREQGKKRSASYKRIKPILKKWRGWNDELLLWSVHRKRETVFSVQSVWLNVWMKIFWVANILQIKMQMPISSILVRFLCTVAFFPIPFLLYFETRNSFTKRDAVLEKKKKTLKNFWCYSENRTEWK